MTLRNVWQGVRLYVTMEATLQRLITQRRIWSHTAIFACRYRDSEGVLLVYDVIGLPISALVLSS